jgi:hypothetical protein
MSKETPTMKKAREVADAKLTIRKRIGYRKMLWNSATQGTYSRKRHGDLE